MLVSIDEWKKQLAAYLIDYNSLDIKESIASGLDMYMSMQIIILDICYSTLLYAHKHGDTTCMHLTKLFTVQNLLN